MSPDQQPRNDDPGGGLSRAWLGIRFPVVLQAPAEPRMSAPIRHHGLSAPRFALRVVFAARRFTVPAGLLLVLSMIGEALVPVIVGAAIDQAIATGDSGRLLWWLGVLAADFAVFSCSARNTHRESPAGGGAPSMSHEKCSVSHSPMIRCLLISGCWWRASG